MYYICLLLFSVIILFDLTLRAILQCIASLFSILLLFNSNITLIIQRLQKCWPFFIVHKGVHSPIYTQSYGEWEQHQQMVFCLVKWSIHDFAHRWMKYPFEIVLNEVRRQKFTRLLCGAGRQMNKKKKTSELTNKKKNEWINRLYADCTRVLFSHSLFFVKISQPYHTQHRE